MLKGFFIYGGFMTTKEIAQALNTDVRNVQNWVKSISVKITSINEKFTLSSPRYPANYDLEETCLIIEEGLGKGTADAFRTNAVYAECESKKAKAVKTGLPSGTQLKEMRLIYGEREAGKRLDKLIGYTESKKEPSIPEQRALQLQNLSKRAIAVEFAERMKQAQKQVENSMPSLFEGGL